jgi:crossover junction endodeoxyribonuclease RuvC
MENQPMELVRILGVDPGTVAMGWAVLETELAPGSMEPTLHPALRPALQTRPSKEPRAHPSGRPEPCLPNTKNLAEAEKLFSRQGYSALLATRLVALGCIMPSKTAPLAERLGIIQTQLDALFTQHSPHSVALERVFVAGHVQAALSLGYARGLVLARAGIAGLAIGEYSPTQAKQALVGHGRADKAQMVAMVQHFFGVHVRHDSADAVALALCHGQRMRLGQHLKTP